MKSWMGLVVVLAVILAMGVGMVGCTASQIDQVIGDLQLGVDAASVAAPLVLAQFSPALAAPVTAYLGTANQVFAEIANITNGTMTSTQKAAAIATAVAALAATNPAGVLPPGASPQLVAEVGAVANALKAVAGLFPANLTLKGPFAYAAVGPKKFAVSRANAARLSQIAAKALANAQALGR